MELLYFILGIIFVQYIIPLLDGIVAWILTSIEAKKIVQSEIINKANIKMCQDAESAKKDPPKRQIGFCADTKECEEDEDEV